MLPGRVLAALPRTDAAAVVRDGARTVVAFGAEAAIAATPDPFAALDATTTGWWAGYAAYELGHAVERVEPRVTFPDPAASVPSLAFVRFAARVEVAADGAVELHGRGPARRALERALAAPAATVGTPPRAPEWTSSLDRGDYELRVRAVQELIRAGECYQVNLTRRLTGPALDPVVALGRARAPGTRRRTRCSGGRRTSRPTAPTIVSASPERFLRVDGRRGRDPTDQGHRVRRRRACERARRTAPRT